MLKIELTKKDLKFIYDNLIDYISVDKLEPALHNMYLVVCQNKVYFEATNKHIIKRISLDITINVVSELDPLLNYYDYSIALDVKLIKAIITDKANTQTYVINIDVNIECNKYSTIIDAPEFVLQNQRGLQSSFILADVNRKYYISDSKENQSIEYFNFDIGKLHIINEFMKDIKITKSNRSSVLLFVNILADNKNNIHTIKLMIGNRPYLQSNIVADKETDIIIDNSICIETEYSYIFTLDYFKKFIKYSCVNNITDAILYMPVKFENNYKNSYLTSCNSLSIIAEVKIDSSYQTWTR